jgi:hypothetical protein
MPSHLLKEAGLEVQPLLLEAPPIGFREVLTIGSDSRRW